MVKLTSFKKILVVNTFGIGDVLFTTPLLRNIKLAMPEAIIDYVGNKRTAEILRANTDIHKVYVYERDDFVCAWKGSKRQFLRCASSLWCEIKSGQYDVVIDVSLNPSFSFFAFLAGIRHRIGFDYKGRGFWLTQKVNLIGYEGKPVADFYLDLLEKLGVVIKERALKLDLQEADKAWAEGFFRSQGINPKDNVFALMPGGGASWGKASSYKRWPAERYAKLADKVIEKKHAKIILIGDASEEALCEDVARRMVSPCMKLFGKTSLGQLAALLARCRLAIVNDGGPLHVATAVGIKTVSIFGPVDEKVYGPYPLGGHRVVTANIACRPCYRRFRVAQCQHHQCLHRISVDDVFSKIGEIA